MKGLNEIAQAKVNITLFDKEGRQIRVDMNVQQEIGGQIKKALGRFGFKPFSSIYNDKKITMDFIKKGE